MIERHGDGEGLEGRAQLVGAESGAVEESVRAAPVRPLRVERGQADQGQQLAALHIHHHAGGTDRPMSGHGFGERLGEDVLNSDVERECERALVGLGAPPQLLVDRLLDAGETAMVHVRETDCMSEEAALGIEALLLTLQPETGNAEPVDGVRLLRRQVVPQQRGLSAGRDKRGRALQVEIGEHATQRDDSLLAIEDLAGLHVKRVGRQVGG